MSSVKPCVCGAAWAAGAGVLVGAGAVVGAAAAAVVTVGWAADCWAAAGACVGWAGAAVGEAGAELQAATRSVAPAVPIPSRRERRLMRREECRVTTNGPSLVR